MNKRQPPPKQGTGRPPDYNLWAKRKSERAETVSGTVGVAWNNDDNTITIRLGPLVVLDNTGEGVILKLYPYEKRATPYAEQVNDSPPQRANEEPPY